MLNSSVGRELEEKLDAIREPAFAPVFELILPHVESMLQTFRIAATASEEEFDQAQQVPDGSNTTVVVIVFFGRQSTFEITHMYLSRNLRVNGGILDHVVLMPNTRQPEDLAYMQYLITSHTWYHAAGTKLQILCIY